MFTDATTEINTRDLHSSSTAIIGHPTDLNKAINKAQEYLLKLQNPEGYWVFELEADCTIPNTQ